MKLSLAPMLKVTTAHYRRLLRIISKDVELFTEMLTADFILRNNHFWKRIGTYDANTTIQIGGCDPEKVALAVEKIVKASEFRKFNLNVGCPSNKVTKGEFGASLMLRKNVVIDIINSVFYKTGVVISVKCRIGVDHHDSFDFFENFIRSVSEQTKCRVFYVHARKCWLCGLSPKENRTKPPINYQFVKDVKKLYPWLEIHLNGEVKSIKDADGLDGIMIGREAMKNMFVFEELLHTGKIWSKCGHNEQFKSNSHILNGHETEDESSDDQNLTDSIALMEISESKHTEKIKLKDHEAINFNQQTKNISETTGGFISETTGELVSEVTGGLISEVTGGLISETTGGLISETTGKTISKTTGELISEVTGGLISETTDKPISKTTGGLVSETTGGLISEVTGGL
ncbi:tRNA-dihydrouridine synthase, partial [Pseudoloma neurophilia]